MTQPVQPAPPAPTQPAAPAPPAPAPPPAAPATSVVRVGDVDIPVVRPDSVSDAEWAALGDPGKAAIVRERARANAAEQALAAVRSTPPQPPAPALPAAPPAPAPKPGDTDQAALVQHAVAAALAPFLETAAQRDAEQAAGAIRDAVTTAAAERFHDATDALAQVDLASLTDGTGRADPAKVTAALDALLLRKPHLGKPVDDRRRPAPGDPVGSGLPSTAPLDDRVKATLARMQSGSGVKFAEA